MIYISVCHLSSALREPQAGGQSWTDTPHLTGSLPSRRKGQAHSPCGIEGGQAPPASPNLLLSGQARQRPGVRCPDCKAPLGPSGAK